MNDLEISWIELFYDLNVMTFILYNNIRNKSNINIISFYVLTTLKYEVIIY